MSGFVLRGASSAVVRGGESATDWFLSRSFSAEKGPTVLFNLHGRTFFFSFLESTRSSGHFPPFFLAVPPRAVPNLSRPIFFFFYVILRLPLHLRLHRNASAQLSVSVLLSLRTQSPAMETEVATEEEKRKRRGDWKGGRGRGEDFQKQRPLHER